MGNANLPVLAQELVDARVDVILADGDRPAIAAFNSTRSIPIVMHATDPVAAGMAKSLARPGGNVTGMVYGAHDYAGKQLDLLRAIQPGLKRMGAVFVPGSVALEVILASWTAAARLGSRWSSCPALDRCRHRRDARSCVARSRASGRLQLQPRPERRRMATDHRLGVRNKVLTTAAEYRAARLQ